MFRRFLALFVVLLGLFGASPARAQSPEVAETAPQDAPMILEPASVTIPPLLGDMTTRDHDWLKLSYPASIDSRVTSLVEDADVFKAELGAYVGQTVLDHVEVRIARSQEDMNALAPVGFPPPRYAVGVAYSALHLVIISLRDPTYGRSDRPRRGDAARARARRFVRRDARPPRPALVQRRPRGEPLRRRLLDARPHALGRHALEDAHPARGSSTRASPRRT